jgi:hypothetical protein
VQNIRHTSDTQQSPQNRCSASLTTQPCCRATFQPPAWVNNALSTFMLQEWHFSTFDLPLADFKRDNGLCKLTMAPTSTSVEEALVYRNFRLQQREIHHTTSSPHGRHPHCTKFCSITSNRRNFQKCVCVTFGPVAGRHDLGNRSTLI